MKLSKLAASLAAQRGYLWSVEDAAKKLHCTKKQAQAAIDELLKAGLMFTANPAMIENPAEVQRRNPSASFVELQFKRPQIAMYSEEYDSYGILLDSGPVIELSAATVHERCNIIKRYDPLAA